MDKSPLERLGLVSALRLATALPQAPARWDSAALAGRLVEISGAGAAATLTLAFDLVLDAQRQGELVAWVSPARSTFYPPDAAEGGVDLEALAVVRAPEARQVGRAAEHFLRSGAFGLVVADLGREAEMPMALQSRLAGLAARHGTLLLCLTEKRRTRPSLGSRVSLRGEAVRERLGENRVACQLRVLKDKRRGPGWTYTELCRGPDGLQ